MIFRESQSSVIKPKTLDFGRVASVLRIRNCGFRFCPILGTKKPGKQAVTLDFSGFLGSGGHGIRTHVTMKKKKYLQRFRDFVLQAVLQMEL